MKIKSKTHSIIKSILMVSVLMFTAVGCERELTKSPDSAKQIESLHEAAKKGDIEQVKLLISKGADVNAKDENENTPLCRAVESGKMEIVRLLVEAGADVNAGSWPPLCEAVDANNVSIAEYLIAHGANVNAPKRWTALQEAASTSGVEMVKLLIAKGADVNVEDSKGRTPLYYAIREENLDTVKLLINAVYRFLA